MSHPRPRPTLLPLGASLVLAVVLAGVPGVPGGAAHASAQVSGEVVLDRDGLRHLHVAVSRTWGVPVRTLERRWGPSRVDPSELPVVYLLAREARVSEEAVLALRDRGWSWMDVAAHLGVNPNRFVRDLPRGRGHGDWRRPSSREVRSFTDADVVYWVNLALRFTTDARVRHLDRRPAPAAVWSGPPGLHPAGPPGQRGRGGPPGRGRGGGPPG